MSVKHIKRLAIVVLLLLMGTACADPVTIVGLSTAPAATVVPARP